MYRTGHQGVNLVLFAPVFAALVLTDHVALGIVGVVTVFATASLPDVDIRLPLVEHRGITHTVWAAAAVGAVVGAPTYLLGKQITAAIPELAVYSSGVLGAYTGGIVAFSIVGHLVGDLLTPMGIRPFSPLWGRSFTLSLWTADSIANKVLFGVGIAVIVATVYAVGTV